MNQNLELIIDETKKQEIPSSKPLIIAVGGGKGGVGKSFFSTNLAIALSRVQNTTIVDLDLGGANVHTCFGIRSMDHTVSDFIHDKVPRFQMLAQKTNVHNLKVIGGMHDTLDIANITQEHIEKIIQGVQSLDSKIVILDLGAGSSNATLDFFLCADKSLFVATPDPTSVENAYRFLKAAFYRKIRNIERHQGLYEFIENSMKSRDQFGIKSPAQLVQHLLKENPIGGKIVENEFKKVHLSLVMNQIRTAQDGQLGFAISSVCKKYFGIACDYMGAINHDDAAWQSMRKGQAVMLFAPHSPATKQISEIAKKLVGSEQKRAVV